MKGALLLITVLLLNTQSHSQLNTATTKQLDSLFASFQSNSRPGCAIIVVRNDEVVYNKSFGLSNLEHVVPITNATVFDIASISKQFAGFAISRLIQEKKIAITDDVRKYIPELPDFGATITINHLVHHTSGLRDWPEALRMAGWRWDEVFSFEDIMRMVQAQRELDFKPGEKYSYSNTGYNLLAEIVTRTTGTRFPKWITENLFTPLGMASSLFLDNHKKVIKNLAYSYRPMIDGFEFAPSYLTAYGSSSMFTTVDDLARWMKEFQNKVRAKDPVFLRMLEPGKLNNGDTVHYGFGLSLDQHRGLRRVSHSGSWAGYRSILQFLPDQDISVAILANSPAIDLNKASISLNILAAAELAPEEKSPVYTAIDKVALDSLQLIQYSGSYRLLPGWIVNISVEKGRLMTQATNELAFPMFSISKNSFWIPAYNATMTFENITQGKSQELRYKNFIAPRIVLVDPKKQDFTRLIGKYYSEELKTEYVVAMVKDQLILQHARNGTIALQPEQKDSFTSSIGSVEFLNGEMLISGSRVKNMRFRKIAN